MVNQNSIKGSVNTKRGRESLQWGLDPSSKSDLDDSEEGEFLSDEEEEEEIKFPKQPVKFSHIRGLPVPFIKDTVSIRPKGASRDLKCRQKGNKEFFWSKCK